ncbi:MAG: nucleotidyltransferase domain-containing protein [Pseudomonadota bacterium]
MLSEQTLREAARLLGEEAGRAKVILFGSYARGEADDGSDADFLVIEPEVENRAAEMVRLYRALARTGIPADILVYSEADVDRRKDWTSSAVHWALKEGKLLYESTRV